MTEFWINHPIVLRGEIIRLIPLEMEHFEELYKAASDKKLWEIIPTDCSQYEKFNLAYFKSLEERDKGKEYPFIIFHNGTERIIGSTRLFEIFPEHQKLEIGWTWIISDYWGTCVNPECKFLLLQFCFEVLKASRVQLKTDVLNLRSRKAIEEIGATFECVSRKDKIKDDGVPRSAAYYSIIDDEWDRVKSNLQNQLNAFQK